jgi:hypothetical protein
MGLIATIGCLVKTSSACKSGIKATVPTEFRVFFSTKYHFARIAAVIRVMKMNVAEKSAMTPFLYRLTVNRRSHAAMSRGEHLACPSDILV